MDKLAKGVILPPKRIETFALHRIREAHVILNLAYQTLSNPSDFDEASTVTSSSRQPPIEQSPLKLVIQI